MLVVKASAYRAGKCQVDSEGAAAMVRRIAPSLNRFGGQTVARATYAAAQSCVTVVTLGP